MENTQFQVTIEWLNNNRTSKGAFTKAQIKSLGLAWPPRSGWMQEISGEMISCDKARSFELAKGSYSPVKSLKYKKVIQSLDKFPVDQVRSIRNKCNQILDK